MKNQIELIQVQMPAAFEFRERLMREIAEETANFHVHVDRCREAVSSAEGFERGRCSTD